MITELTPADHEMLAEVAREWIGHGLNTQRANRPVAEASMRLAYQRGGQEPPEHIIWAGSPFAATVVDATIQAVLTGRVSERDVRAALETDRYPVHSDTVYGPAVALGVEYVLELDRPVREGAYLELVNLLRPAIRGQNGLGYASVQASVNVYWDFHWLAYHDAMLRLGVKECAQLDGLQGVAKHCPWWIGRERLAIMAEPPHQIVRDQTGRLHSIATAAMQWPDMWSIYVVRGTRMPKWIFEEPEKLTGQAILSEQNQEIAAVMLERLGNDEFVRQVKGEILDEDVEESGYPRRLVRIEAPNTPDGEIRLVYCMCPSKGSSHYLRVRPSVRTCAEAVASTFQRRADQWAPTVQS